MKRAMDCPDEEPVVPSKKICCGIDGDRAEPAAQLEMEDPLQANPAPESEPRNHPLTRQVTLDQLPPSVFDDVLSTTPPHRLHKMREACSALRETIDSQLFANIYTTYLLEHELIDGYEIAALQAASVATRCYHKAKTTYDMLCACLTKFIHDSYEGNRPAKPSGFLRLLPAFFSMCHDYSRDHSRPYADKLMFLMSLLRVLKHLGDEGDVKVEQYEDNIDIEVALNGCEVTSLAPFSRITGDMHIKAMEILTELLAYRLLGNEPKFQIYSGRGFTIRLSYLPVPLRRPGTNRPTIYVTTSSSSETKELIAKALTSPDMDWFDPSQVQDVDFTLHVKCGDALINRPYGEHLDFSPDGSW